MPGGDPNYPVADMHPPSAAAVRALWAQPSIDRCARSLRPGCAQAMAIGYAVVVPYAIWMNDYAAVAYPLADGAPQLCPPALAATRRRSAQLPGARARVEREL